MTLAGSFTFVRGSRSEKGEFTSIDQETLGGTQFGAPSDFITRPGDLESQATTMRTAAATDHPKTSE